MDIYDQKIWRKGCDYMVSREGGICNKCGEFHNQTAYEAEIGLFKRLDGDGDAD